MRKIFIFIILLFFHVNFIYASNKFKVTLESCIDGDTAKFNIKGEVKTVRFLSIDTPEIEHDEVEAQPYGNEAKKYTCNLLKQASIIKLQYDTKSDSTDKYGRVLAWVFVDDDLLQAKLVENGLAQVKYVYDDYMYSSDLQALEESAKEREVGIWSSSDDNFDHSNYVFYVYFSLFIVVIVFLYRCFKKIISF